MIGILVRETSIRNPDYDEQIAEDARASGLAYNVPRRITVQAGYRLSHPEVWKLVTLGAAIPGDDECRRAALARGFDEDRMQRAILAAGKLAAGITEDIEEEDPTDDDTDDDV